MQPGTGLFEICRVYIKPVLQIKWKQSDIWGIHIWKELCWFGQATTNNSVAAAVEDQ